MLQDILRALPGLFFVVIATGFALYLIRSGNSMHREQQARWYGQPRIVVGIGILFLAVGQAISNIFAIPALSHRFSLDTVSLFRLIGGGISLLCFVLVLYAKILQIRSRQPGDDEEPASP